MVVGGGGGDGGCHVYKYWHVNVHINCQLDYLPSKHNTTSSSLLPKIEWCLWWWRWWWMKFKLKVSKVRACIYVYVFDKFAINSQEKCKWIDFISMCECNQQHMCLLSWALTYWAWNSQNWLELANYRNNPKDLDFFFCKFLWMVIDRIGHRFDVMFRQLNTTHRGEKSSYVGITPRPMVRVSCYTMIENSHKWLFFSHWMRQFVQLD